MKLFTEIGSYKSFKSPLVYFKENFSEEGRIRKVWTICLSLSDNEPIPIKSFGRFLG